MNAEYHIRIGEKIIPIMAATLLKAAKFAMDQYQVSKVEGKILGGHTWEEITVKDV